MHTINSPSLTSNPRFGIKGLGKLGRIQTTNFTISNLSWIDLGLHASSPLPIGSTIQSWLLAFSSLATSLRDCSTTHSPPEFFFKVEIRSRTIIPLIRPGSIHDGSANVHWQVACEFVSGSVPTMYLDSGIVSLVSLLARYKLAASSSRWSNMPRLLKGKDLSMFTEFE